MSSTYHKAILNQKPDSDNRTVTESSNKRAFDLLLFVRERVKKRSVGANSNLTNGEQGI